MRRMSHEESGSNDGEDGVEIHRWARLYEMGGVTRDLIASENVATLAEAVRRMRWNVQADMLVCEVKKLVA